MWRGCDQSCHGNSSSARWNAWDSDCFQSEWRTRCSRLKQYSLLTRHHILVELRFILQHVLFTLIGQSFQRVFYAETTDWSKPDKTLAYSWKSWKRLLAKTGPKSSRQSILASCPFQTSAESELEVLLTLVELMMSWKSASLSWRREEERCFALSYSTLLKLLATVLLSFSCTHKCWITQSQYSYTTLLAWWD